MDTKAVKQFLENAMDELQNAQGDTGVDGADMERAFDAGERPEGALGIAVGIERAYQAVRDLVDAVEELDEDED